MPGEDLGDGVDLVAAGRRARDDIGPGARLVDGDELLGQAAPVHAVALGDDRDDRGALGPLHRRAAGDELVAGADPLVGGDAETDDVDVEQGLPNHVVEPLPSRVRGLCAAPECRRGSACHAGVVTMPRTVCRVVCGFDDVIATFAHQGVGQVDFPALGRPTRAAKPARYGASGIEVSFGASGRGRRRDRLDEDRREAVSAPGHPFGGEEQPGHLGARPRLGHLADGLGQQPADGVDLVLVDADGEQVGEVVDGHSGRHPEPAVPERLDARGVPVVLVGDLPDDLLEDVPMVTRPAVPPYSSTTTAMWFWSRCISRSRSSTFFDLGDEDRGRMTR